MKISIHLDMEEIDYMAIVQAANYRRKSTEDFIKEAIREAIEKAMIDMRAEQMQQMQSFQQAAEQQNSGAEEEVRGSKSKKEKE
jgi:uncharacterized protein (DUF1778 family)